MLNARRCLSLLAPILLLCLSFGAGLAENNTLTQYSTLGALFQGVYDGRLSLRELGSHGGFGLGTVNGLDGELVVLGGRFYQVRVDGTVHMPPPETRTPFAAVTAFESDQRHRVQGPIGYAGLRQKIDRLIASENFFYAVKVEGVFAQLTARSVRKQAEPYRPLAEVVKTQSVFEFGNTRGTLVGFRVPVYAQSLNVAGFHLHFLTADKTRGGHVLNFVLEKGTIEIDELPRLLLLLPETDAFREANLAPAEPAALKHVEGPR